MEKDINILLERFRNEIDSSSGHGFLYQYFEDMDKNLKNWCKTHYDDTVNRELLFTIGKLCEETKYCKYATPGWAMYAARCFYCADHLARYLSSDSNRQITEEHLSKCFRNMINSYSIIFIDIDLIRKYVDTEICKLSTKQMYVTIINSVVDKASEHNPIKASIEYMAFRGSKCAHDLILEYVEKYSDYSWFKYWIPELYTDEVYYIWYNYPDKYISNQTGMKSTIQQVEKYLEDSMDLHFKLWELWWQYNPKEVVEECESEQLIDVLEAIDDESFRNILNSAVTIPSDKVKYILEYFSSDSESWVRDFSERLLQSYTIDS